MSITLETIESFLLCNYKAYLKIKGVCGSRSDYEVLYNELKESLFETVTNDLKSKQYTCLNLNATIITASVLQHGHDYLINGRLLYDDIHVNCELLEKLPQKSNLGNFTYIPSFVTTTDKIQRQDKAKLSVIALALSNIQGNKIDFGRIYHPNGSKKIKLNSVLKTSKILDEIKKLSKAQGEPPLLLNKNCKVCEFHSHCMPLARETDNLSLLSGITPKEISKKNSKGIFTINQLSYTFKPRRKRKRKSYYRNRFLCELKALAIRENKIYVYEIPEMPQSPVEIFCDFEGINNELYCYLIGVLIKERDTLHKHYFWADDSSEELDIFKQFVSVIGKYEKFTFYHYGSYEINHLKRIAKKLTPKERRNIERIIASSCNLLSFFYSHIYLPTYSNELKEIGKYLDFRWSDEKASGIQSVVWRKRWEITKEDTYKNTLIQYNYDDCSALVRVRDLISSIIRNRDIPSSGGRLSSTIYCNELKKQSIFSFQAKNFALPEIDLINKCSYFDYQRERIYARVNPVIKKAQLKSNKNSLKPNQNIYVIALVCPFCKSKQIQKGVKISKKVIELKFSPSGVKKWIIEYKSNKYSCSICKKVFLPHNYLKVTSKFGHNLICWTIYQHIVNKESFRQISVNLEELFSLHIPKTTLHFFKTCFMKYYETTYKRLVKKVLKSEVIYIDETPLIMTTETGYGWVLTNVEEVISFYKPTREGEFLKELFENYKGILMTDFYAAYDTVDCQQQKCLIHFMRDLNDDLLKNPFDNEFKELTQSFTLLLQNIVKTIDKYGLRKRYLHKHQKEADKFLSRIESMNYSSEICQQYQKRIIKNKGKLFLFLAHDNVSWNNNNAEHAIKLLATHSNKNLSAFKSTRMEEYLKIMSIYQTCKYKGISFLKFLLSREKDIDVFYDKNLKGKRG